MKILNVTLEISIQVDVEKEEDLYSILDNASDNNTTVEMKFKKFTTCTRWQPILVGLYSTSDNNFAWFDLLAVYDED